MKAQPSDISSAVLDMSKDEAQAYVRRKIREGRLSKVVANLNEQALAGTSQSGRNAQKALRRLGFVD